MVAGFSSVRVAGLSGRAVFCFCSPAKAGWLHKVTTLKEFFNHTACVLLAEMIAALGPRYDSRQEPDEKIILKPSTSTYLVNVVVVPDPPMPRPFASGATPSPTATALLDTPAEVMTAMQLSRSRPSRRQPSVATTSAGSLRMKGDGDEGRPQPASPPPPPPPEALPSSSVAAVSVRASQSFFLHLKRSDTPVEALTRIQTRCRQRSAVELGEDTTATTGGNMTRPPASYMIFQTFADFSIDFSKRAISGTSVTPLIQLLDFPYFLLIRQLPWDVERERIVGAAEPERRHGIFLERHVAATVFFLQYATILKQLSQFERFISARNNEIRQRRRLVERTEYFDVALLLLVQEEHASRSRCDASQRSIAEVDRAAFDWHKTSFYEKDALYRCVAEEMAEASHSLALVISRTRLREALEERFRDLTGRVTAALNNDYTAALACAYTTSRLSLVVRVAQDRQLEISEVNQAMKQSSRRWYERQCITTCTDSGVDDATPPPDIVDSATICGDVFSRSAISIVEASCGSH